MKRITAFLLTLIISAGASAQEKSTGWRLEVTSKLGPIHHRHFRFCSKDQCQKERQDYFDKLIKVCLYRDEATKGWFTSGKWRTVVKPEDGGLCKEVFFADPDSRTLYLEIPSASNLMTIRCSDRERAHGIRPHPPSSDYDVCSSSFFARLGNLSSEKLLKLERVKEALQEAQFVESIEKHLAARRLREAEDAQKAYRLAFEKADSLESIKAFEQKYQDNDPENFIGQLSLGKRTLEVAEYRKRYESLQSMQDLQNFITDYKTDDPDGRLPEVEQRLSAMKQAAELQAKLEADRKAAEANSRTLQDIERQIRWCKSESEAAQRAIDREHQVGLISGYVNKQIMHLAGTTIIECKSLIPNTYKRYRQLGGTKPLEEIR